MSMSKEKLSSSEKQEQHIIDTAQELTALPPKIQRFIQLYMAGTYTVSQIAQLLDVSPRSCFLWLERSDVKRIIEETQRMTHEAVALNIKQLTLKAMNRLDKLIDSPVDAVALNAVKDVLDRAGHKPKNEIKIDKTVTTIEEKLKSIIDVTLEDTIIEGEFKDAE